MPARRVSDWERKAMRQIGTLPDEREARTFQDFLLTRGVNAKVDADADQFAIWVIDEDHVDTAKQELESFRAEPNAQRYADGRAEAERIRDTIIKQAKDARKKVVDVRQKWDRPLTSRCPVTFMLMAISITVAFASKLGEEYDPVLRYLSYASYDQGGGSIYFYGLAQPQNDIRRGEVWRLVTPIFIHYGFPHVFFNMMWMLYLGMAVELRAGSMKYLMMVLAMAVISNTAQYLYEGPGFGGMSGVVFGLFGYVWLRGKYDPNSGYHLSPLTVFLMLGSYVLSFTGALGSIANMAHAFGLATGAVLGYAPIAWRDATKR